MRRAPLTIAALVLLLAGCATAPDATPPPEPTPTESAATENEVASVLAEYESDWRETIEDAGECRFVWVLGSTVQDEVQGMTCYLQEQTIGITAQLVVRDWEALDIPTSIQPLVRETTTVLEQVSAIDFGAACGDDALPNDTDECTEASGSRNFYYSLLESVLDRWRPYL